MTCLHCQQLEARCGQLRERIARLTAVEEAARGVLDGGCCCEDGQLYIGDQPYICEMCQLKNALSALDGQGAP